MKRIGLACCIAAFFVASAARAAGVYVITDLGSNLPNGINSYGQIAGDSAPGFPSPFLWTPTTPNATTGTSVTLPQPASGFWSGVDINDYGQIVAGLPTSFPPVPPPKVYLWKPTVPNGSAGTWTLLSGLSIAGRINASGQVAGYADVPFSSADHMVLWSPTTPNGTSGSTVDLGDLPGGSPFSLGSKGLDINSRGQIPGSGNINVVGGQEVLWSPTTPNASTGSMVALTSYETYRGAINDMGQVALMKYSNNFVQLWTPAAPNAPTGTVTDVGHLSGSSQNYPYAINSAGSIVGYAVTGGTARAFLWEPDIANGSSGTLYDLNTLLSPADAFNWTLGNAFDMNDRGQIVGIARYDPDGPGPSASTTRGFLLTPVPEPATSVLFICAFFQFALMCERRKRQR